MEKRNDCKNCANAENCENKTSPYADSVKELKIKFWTEINKLCLVCIQELQEKRKKTKYLYFFKDKILIPARNELQKEDKNPVLLDFLSTSGYLDNPDKLDCDINLLNRGIKKYRLFFKKIEFSEKEKEYLIILFYNLSLKSESKIKKIAA